MDSDTLIEQFVKAANSFGYDDADIEIGTLVHFKVKWVRSGDWIKMTVSDYLLALTPAAAYDIADGLFRQITGEGITAPYYGRAAEELSSEAFARANQDTFAKRNCLDESPLAWREYQDLAMAQGVQLPAAMRVFVAPDGYEGDSTYPSMRVAIMPRDMAQSGLDALAWIEDATVRIGKGHCGWKADAPDRYVRLSRGRWRRQIEA